MFRIQARSGRWSSQLYLFESLRRDHVFVVGLPRSGTSIVYRTIQKLPAFRFGSVNFSETHAFCDGTSFVPSGTRYWNLLGYLRRRLDVYMAFLRAIRAELRHLEQFPEEESYEVNFESFEQTAVRELPVGDDSQLREKWVASARCRIIRKYFRFAQSVRSFRRLVEKTPHHYLHVPQILWTYPKARIVWMIRHPVDTLASSIERSARDPVYENYWDTDGFIGEYDSNFRRLNYDERTFPGRILRVRYEDFVAQPHQVTERICAFIHERFDPAALTMKESEVPPGNPPDALLFGGIAARAGRRWAGIIARADAGRIERALTARMEEMGYQKVS
jgi:hypothetical protein